MTHKFSVGQAVWYNADRGVEGTGQYTVVRTLPATEAGKLQYRVKAKVDGSERVVLEDQLARRQSP